MAGPEKRSPCGYFVTCGCDGLLEKHKHDPTILLRPKDADFGSDLFRVFSKVGNMKDSQFKSEKAALPKRKRGTEAAS